MLLVFYNKKDSPDLDSNQSSQVPKTCVMTRLHYRELLRVSGFEPEFRVSRTRSLPD